MCDIDVSLRYSCGRTLLLLNHLYYISSESSRYQEAKNHHILCVVSKKCDAIDCYVIGILNLVWAVTSEPVKIKSWFLLLWAGYDLGTWFGVQSVGYRHLTMYLQRFFVWNSFLPISHWFAMLGLLKIVFAAKVWSHICEVWGKFPRRSIKTPNKYDLAFVTINLMLFC